MQVPECCLYGVQTMRGVENFPISMFHLSDCPSFVKGLAITKLGAAMANHRLGLLTDEQFNAISQACREIMDGKHLDQFPVDMIQGGAETQRTVPSRPTTPIPQPSIWVSTWRWPAYASIWRCLSSRCVPKALNLPRLSRWAAPSSKMPCL